MLTCSCAPVTVAIITVRQLPPSESRSTVVISELRYGTWRGALRFRMRVCNCVRVMRVACVCGGGGVWGREGEAKGESTTPHTHPHARNAPAGAAARLARVQRDDDLLEVV